MGAHQRELGVVVVEHGIEPIRGGVADGTIGGEPGGNVIRIVRGVKCGQVTTGALRRGIHVVVVHVTLRAGRIDVGAGERELGRVVVEGGRRPGCGAVAYLAGGGEPRGNVVRVGCGLVDVQVTPRAHGGSVGELVVHVALGAGRIGVGAGERESGGGVVEGGGQPGARVVAQGAIRGETGGRMIRVGGGRVLRSEEHTSELQ